jgi:hypothetical protein
MWKEAVVAYFKHLPLWIDGKHKNASIRISGPRTEIRIRDLLYREWKF